MGRMPMKMVGMRGVLLALLLVTAQSSRSSASEVGSIDYGVEMMPEKPYLDAVFRDEKADAQKLNPIAGAEKTYVEERVGMQFHPNSDAGKTMIFSDDKDDLSVNSRPDLDKARGSVLFGSDNDRRSDQSANVHGSKDGQTNVDLRRSIEQIEILILEQRNQVQNLERMIGKLKQVTERLENKLLLASDQNSDDDRSPRNRFEFFTGSSMKEEVDAHKQLSTCTDQQGLQVSECIKNENVEQTGRKGKDEDAHVVGMVIEKDANEKEAGITSDGTNVDSEEASKGIVKSPSSLMETGIKSSRKSPHGGMTIARYKPAWSEYFQFLSAVKVDGDVTCLHVLPHEGEEGLSKHVAVGVNTGRVYIFSLYGDLLVDFSTRSPHPITAMLSFFSRRNETMFLTGHADGSVVIHKLLETEPHKIHLHGDDWHGLLIEHMKTLTSHSKGLSSSQDEGEGMGAVGDRPKVGLVDKLITILEVYRVGKMRYILATDAGGNIRVFRENGTFYGTAKSPSRPLTFLRSPNSQRLLFLTEDGVASVDLRSLSIQVGPCEGLGTSRVISYAFDASGRPKAHGFTLDGDLIYVALSGDTLRFQCNVRSRRKREGDGHVFPQAIKGYLLLATRTDLLVYNTTLHDPPRLLFTAPIHEISLSFLSTRIPGGNNHPLMASNRERLVVLGFSGGYVSMYRSNLPLHKPMQPSTKFWNSPLFVLIAILVGGWQFFSKKRDVFPAPLQENSENLLSPSSEIMQGYTTQAARDRSKEAVGSSRRFNSFPSGNIKYRNPVVADLNFRTSPTSSLETRRSSTASTTLDNVGESSSLEPHSYLNREDVNARFRAATVESGLESAESAIDSFLKEDTHNKQLRSIAAGHCFRTVSEPTSF